MAPSFLTPPPAPDPTGGIVTIVVALIGGSVTLAGLWAKLTAGARQREADRLEAQRRTADEARDRREAERAERLAKEVDAWHQQVKAERDEVRKRLGELEATAWEREKRVVDLEGRVSDLETSLAKAQSRVSELEKALEVVTFERDTEKDRSIAMTAEIATLNGMLAEAKREARRLEDLLREAGRPVVATEPVSAE